MRSQLTMLFSKRILILLLFFIFNSCDIIDPPPPLDLCNTQFRGDECYIQSMQEEGLTIKSYSDNAIRLTYLLEDLSILLADSTISYDSVSVIPDSLIIERKLGSDSIYTEIISIPYSDAIDSYLDTMIYDTGLYHYRLATKNENGRSLYDSDSINHQLPQIKNISIGDKNCSNIPILWECDIDTVFEKEYDTLKFQIEQILSDTDTVTYNIDLPYDGDNEYQFDNDDFDLGSEYEYRVAFQGKTINSLSATVHLNIPKPSEEAVLNWVPISSDIMHLEWDIGGDMILYDSIKVTNEVSGIPHVIYKNNDTPTTTGYLFDSLSTYNNEIEIMAGHKVEYLMQWYCREDSNDTNFGAATLPYYNMVYIPSVSNYEYTEITTLDEIYDYTISTDAFYIDTYEITENVYNEPNSNTPLEANSLPKSSLSYDGANTFAQNRHPEDNSNISCDELSQIEFRIPQDYEWQIASRCHQYDWETKLCDEYLDYPISIEGENAIPSCNFINYKGCCDDINIDDCVQSVDQYPESITPFGLYGTSGNLQEWVLNNNSSMNTNKLMGGYFLSTFDEITTKSVFYFQSNSAEHQSFGFRTVFDADEFLEIWKDCVD